MLLQPDVYDVLLSLADLSSDELVRQNAMQLLETMPTDSSVVQQLTAVLDSKSPCQGMWQLLVGTGTAAKPARLLYTIQVCSLLHYTSTLPLISCLRTCFSNTIAVPAHYCNHRCK